MNKIHHALAAGILTCASLLATSANAGAVAPFTCAEFGTRTISITFVPAVTVSEGDLVSFPYQVDASFDTSTPEKPSARIAAYGPQTD